MEDRDDGKSAAPPGRGRDRDAMYLAPPGGGQDSDPSIDPRDVLEKDPSIAKKLAGYAYKKTHHVARAKDAAQQAVLRVLEGTGFYRWDPGE